MSLRLVPVVWTFIECVLYSVLFLTVGNPNQHTNMTANKPMAMGCNTNVPAACARMPVVNGATAPPELPKALITLKLLTWSFRPMDLEKITVAQG